MNQGTLIDVPPYAGEMDDDVRFTLDDADLWLRSKAGVDSWDLDAAACHESHRAERYYTLERSEDGLVLPWARRTFINPPWSKIEPWIGRARHACETDPGVDIVGLLLPLRTHVRWWQWHVEPFFDAPGEIRMKGSPYSFTVRVCHPPTRFRYGCPGNPRGVGVPEPNFQSVGIIFRRTT